MAGNDSAFHVIEMKTKRGWFEYDWVLLGPDGLVWHVATFPKQLRERADELNRVWELAHTMKRG